MNIDRVQALLAASALCTTPFLFGAQGKGCQPLSFPDAGVDASSSAPDSDSSVCIDRVLCIRGDHFDPVACKCVADEDASPETDAAVPQESGVCIDRILCVRGDHFDPVACKCVPDEDASPGPDAASDACIDNVLCIRGDHFDPVACKCVPDEDASSQPDAGGRRCIDNVLCIQGDHWDPVACKCVPGCMSAADCHGALPQVCVAECDGGPGACAHFACRAGACETVICE
jgi:hypothetical protein